MAELAPKTSWTVRFVIAGIIMVMFLVWTFQGNPQILNPIAAAVLGFSGGFLIGKKSS